MYAWQWQMQNIDQTINSQSKDYSIYGISQWETTLQYNIISH